MKTKTIEQFILEVKAAGKALVVHGDWYYYQECCTDGRICDLSIINDERKLMVPCGTELPYWVDNT